jgi:transcriptional regulator with XRE-family HTH domain
MTLGERLKKARKDMKLTQEAVAAAIGIAKTTYNGYERDFRKPDVLTVQKLAAILNVTGSYIIGSEEEVTTESNQLCQPTDDQRRQLHEYIDTLTDEEVRAMCVVFRIGRT